jgi:adenylosuccinate lyase
MKKNLTILKGLIFSQQILLSLAESGVTREDAYRMVQTQAMRVWKDEQDFKTLILKDKEICSHLSEEKIEEIFDVNYHLKYINAIFDRVFG